jgi:hypothetical protein
MAIFLMILAACGGNEETPEIVPTVAPPAEVEPTEAPPTEAATVQPTEAPTEAPTMEPTAEPTDAEPTAESVALAGNCENAYYPVVEGRVYTYSSNIAGLGESNYTQTFSDVTEDSFTITTSVDVAEAITQTWTCTGEGILAPEFTQIPGAAQLISVEVVEAEGITIPPSDSFQQGESWSTHYVINATMGDGSGNEFTMTETIDLTNTVAGIEAVSVPAGDFPDALRVDTVGTIGIDMGGTGIQSTLEMNYTSWYAQDVGMVRQEFESLLDLTGQGSEPSVSELVSVE